MSDGSSAMNGAPSEKEDLISLNGWSPSTVGDFLNRTARYASNPRGYLHEALGSDIVEQRRHFLCIPDEVDKDIYGQGSHKSHFEQHLAKLLAKESGLFFITGVQAQLAALRVHCQKAGNKRVAWHVTSHLESAEERAYEELYGLERVLLGGNEDENPTVEEIKKVLALPKDERPAVVLVELPNRELGCKTYTFDQLETISSACKAAGVMFHCDGARLWEIEPYYQKTAGKTFADIGRLFDSVYVSFYKGLRGVAGAMLVGSEELIREAKIWQRRAGGNVVSLMYELIDCERGFNENVGTFERKWKKMSEVQDRITSATEKYKTTNGEAIVQFVAVPTTCCQVRTVLSGFTTDELTAAKDKVAADTNILLFKNIRPKATLDERTKAERDGTGETPVNSADRVTGVRHEMEWMMGNDNERLDTKVFVDAYVALCEILVATEAARKQ